MKLSSSYICEIEILSPVHIGSGERLNNGLDFLIRDKKAVIVSMKKLMDRLHELGSDAAQSLTDAIESNRLEEWLRNQGIALHDIAKRSHPVTERVIREIHPQICSGTGQPFIPGSSLKGAFRTALLLDLATKDQFKIVQDTLENLIEKEKVNLKFADSNITKILGKDPKFNLMRSLTVGDFHTASDRLFLPCTYVYSLSADNKLAREKKGKFDMKNFPESIGKSAIAHGQIAFDDYLQHHAVGKENFEAFSNRLSLAWLIACLRQKTEQTIAKDEAFFTDYGNNKDCREVAAFYQKLKDECENLQDNEAILQIAWGSGWRGMTGPLLQDDDLTDELRKKLKLAANRLNFPFPKTRKVALTPQGARPFGWIKIKFTDKEEVKEKERIELQEKIEQKKFPWKSTLKELKSISDLNILQQKIKKDERIIKWLAEIEEVEKTIRSKIVELVEDSASSIDNWGDLKQKFLMNELVKQWINLPEITQAVQNAVNRVVTIDKKRGKWTEDREKLVSKFFDAAGLKWHPHSGQEEKTGGSAAVNTSLLKEIEQLSSWKDYRRAKIKIKDLDLACCKALKKKFQEWKLKKSKDKTQKKTYNAIINRIKQLEKNQT